MGCGDTNPYYPGKAYLDWEVSDPAGLEFSETPHHIRRCEPLVYSARAESSGLSCFVGLGEQVALGRPRAGLAAAGAA